MNVNGTLWSSHAVNVYLTEDGRENGSVWGYFSLSDAFIWRLSDVCLSVAYIGPNSRTERPRKTIGTEVAHVKRDLDTTFKAKRSKVNLLLLS